MILNTMRPFAEPVPVKTGAQSDMAAQNDRWLEKEYSRACRPSRPESLKTAVDCRRFHEVKNSSRKRALSRRHIKHAPAASFPKISEEKRIGSPTNPQKT